MKRSMQTFLATLCVACLVPLSAQAALISLGDPTTELEGSLFLNDATTGGGDTAIITPPGSLNPARYFDLDGLPGAPGVGGVVTIQGFGFATNASTTQNTATSVTITVTYLGADELVGGTDDIEIGSESVLWNNGADDGGWDGAGTYYVNFDTDPSAAIDGLGERFRITVAPDNGSIRFKVDTGGVKFSMSGTFAAVPEPASLLALIFGAAAVLSGRPHRV
ncbi:hypothetical protein [Botrimarina hoheduenensis]|uniref:PEP-CTERM protein-sorting domain-containing protein n=1 Tax=Botrimarina hoheduenensis TaxID=2528000 RepID=A0A5C5WCP2_9BACT|nr:hypothetical protein [Botrimarina hoheduenensis]TWT47845.1 hypothetical protein Pla111_14700 [Botrimarina hoheduenensis]